MGKKKKQKKHGCKRSAKQTRAIKEQLYAKHGHFCWLCGRHFNERQLTLHHIIPFRICKDTTIVNSFIACHNCHFGIINQAVYGSQDSLELMEQGLKWKREHEL